ECGLRPVPLLYASSRRRGFASAGRSCSTTLSHGAPHRGQALGDDPARIHSSGNRSGNVAKCASGNRLVFIVHTLRRLRISRGGVSFRSSRWLLCACPGTTRAVILPPIRRKVVWRGSVVTAGSAIATAS